VTTKRVLSFLISSLLLSSFFGIISTTQAQNPQQLWALIICGSTGLSFSNNTQYMYHTLTQNYTFSGIYYLDVNTSRSGVDALSTRSNVRSAITSWLGARSDVNDIIFIYFSSHGGGYCADYSSEFLGMPFDHVLPYVMRSGRYDESGDEGNEVRESTFREYCWRLNALYDYQGDGPPYDLIRNLDSDPYIEIDYDNDGSIDDQFDNLLDLDGDGWDDDILLDPDSDDCCDIAIDADVNHDGTIDNFISDGEDTDGDRWIVGLDLNGNGNSNDWVGMDECMQVQDDLYWDDELASDVNTLSYAKLIFVRQGCLEEEQGCFGGGLIDDISAPKRIIMSATDETHHSIGDMDDDGFSEWSEAFIDALYGKDTYWNGNAVVDESPPVYVDADWNNDGHVSMWEAWDYAWYNDGARLAGLETPWLDDNGNGLPTYRNEEDDLDQLGSYLLDGLFSMETYFGFENLKTPDINEDGVVNMLDMSIVSIAMGSHGPDYPNPGDPPSEKWNPLADLNNDNHITILDIAIVAIHYYKYYSDPPSPVSTETIVFTYPIRTNVRKGEIFSVNVVLFNVDNLRGWEFKLYWNNAVLKCTSAELHVPDAWDESVFEAGPGVENDFNATHGTYCRAVSALYPAPPFNGSMVLVTLTFQATAAGRTRLDLQETILADNEAHAIPHIAIDALVTVRKR